MRIARLPPGKPELAGQVMRLYTQLELEQRPTLPPIDPAAFRSKFSIPILHRTFDHFLAFNCDSIVGFGCLEFKQMTANAASRGTIFVLPSFRGQGIGSLLLQSLTSAAKSYGRTTLVIATPVGVTSEQFLVRMGLQRKAVVVESHLSLDRTALSRADDAIEDRRDLVSEYNISGWESPIPEPFIDIYTEAKQWINEAPQGERTREVRSYTASWLRQQEEQDVADGKNMLVIMATTRHTSTIAGLTEVYVSKHWPSVAAHHDTLVNGAHRGRGLATWIKALMIRRLNQRYPELKKLITSNAIENAPMRQVNQNLGFVETYSIGKWEQHVN